MNSISIKLGKGIGTKELKREENGINSNLDCCLMEKLKKTKHSSHIDR